METVTIEKQQLALLLKRHCKLINIVELLTYHSKAFNFKDVQLKAEEVCTLFKITMYDLREGRRAGNIRSYHLNGVMYYTAGDIIDFVEKRDNLRIDELLSQKNLSDIF